MLRGERGRVGEEDRLNFNLKSFPQNFPNVQRDWEVGGPPNYEQTSRGPDLPNTVRGSYSPGHPPNVRGGVLIVGVSGRTEKG